MKTKLLRCQFDGQEIKTYYITDNEEATLAEARLVANKAPVYGLDIETLKLPQFKDHKQAGLSPHLSDIRLVQVYDGEAIYVFDMLHVHHSTVWGGYLSVQNFMAHNAKFEQTFLQHRGAHNVNIGCSMIMSRLIHCAEHSPYDPEPEEQEELEENPDGMSRYKRTEHSLEAVSNRLFNIHLDKQHQASDWSLPELSNEQILYAALDAVLTVKVAYKLLPQIKKHGMGDVYKLNRDSLHAAAEMEVTGMHVDWAAHEKLVVKWKEEKELADKACEPFFGKVNLQSSKQMGAWLESYVSDKAVLNSWPKTPKGAYTFNRFSIAPFWKLPAIRALLEYKKYTKLLDTYGEPLLEKRNPLTGRIHTSYSIAETTTGRWSSRNPNLQNQLRDGSLRNIFCAPEGKKLVVADFSQIETRLQGELSQDPFFLSAYERGQDVYKLMAARLLGSKPENITKEQRQIGKVIVLALGYGMGPNKLAAYSAANYGVTLEKNQAHRFWGTYHNTVKVYSRWCELQRRAAESIGYVTTLMGKKRKLNKDEVYTRAPNHRVQGTAAELQVLAANDFWTFRKGKSAKLVCSIHDELVVECDEDTDELVAKALEKSMNTTFQEMFNKDKYYIVAEAKIVNRWGEK